MWEFSALVTKSLLALKHSTRNDPIARYKLYYEHDLDAEEWFVPAMVQLVTQEELSVAQSEQLGLAAAVRVSTLRGECSMYSALNAGLPIEPGWLTTRIRERWNIPQPPGRPATRDLPRRHAYPVMTYVPGQIFPGHV